MAFPEHALLAFGGRFTTTDMADEVWQFGIRLSTHDGAGRYLSNPQTYVDAIKTPVTTWFSAALTSMDSRAQLTTLKCNNIKPDGHYKDAVTHQAVFSAVAGNVLGTLPLFCTPAVTLETGHSTGRARRGRVYPPFANSLGSATLGVSMGTAARDGYRNALKSLLTILLINEPTGGALVQPVIVSRIDGSYNDINGVSCNSVIDVQRRRKNRATGTRSTVAAFP